MKKKILFFTLLCICTNAFSAPKVILKLDDLVVKNNECSCSTTMDILRKNNVKASFGIIVDRCDSTIYSGLLPYLNSIDNKGKTIFEFWHHGYDHKRPEFGGNPYEYQKRHFIMADSIVKNNVKLQMQTFGSPFNHVDESTAKVIKENEHYKYVFLAKTELFKGSGITVLNNLIKIETGTGVINFKYFKENYIKEKASEKSYIVLQGHPNQWGKERIQELIKIIEFLKEEGCEFVLPSTVNKPL